MTAKPLYPLLFSPVLKHYLWGGHNLARFGRALPDQPTAESWEIAAHADGATIVADGPFGGRTLPELQAELGLDLLGRNGAAALARGKFPLLIKLLDAALPLSVQVHPNDAYARSHERDELGKTEMWVVLDAQPGAAIVLGLAKGVTREQFRRALADGHLDDCLHHLPVQAGDHICVPAGTLHAILGGLVVAEIQQNSNTTYRVYDWNRRDAEGRTRPLHTAKALDVIDFDLVAPALPTPAPLPAPSGQQRWALCRTDYFVVERVALAGGARYDGHCDGTTFEIWGVLDGRVRLNDRDLAPITFTLLPAALGDFGVNAITDATLLRVTLPAPPPAA